MKAFCSTSSVADLLAKDALKQAVAANQFISSNFPLKNIRVFANGSKVTASVNISVCLLEMQNCQTTLSRGTYCQHIQL
jgi:hypothetical protein